MSHSHDGSHLLAQVGEAFARWTEDPIAAIALLLETRREQVQCDLLLLAAPPVAWRLHDVAYAVERAERAHRVLWDTVLDDPLEGDLLAAAREALRATEDAEHALENLRDETVAALGAHEPTPSGFRLRSEQWLEIFEDESLRARRGGRSPLQLFRLAQLTRTNATKRAQLLLRSAEPRTATSSRVARFERPRRREPITRGIFRP